MKEDFPEFTGFEFNPEFVNNFRFYFRPDIARKIGQRDGWTCRCGCGRSFKKGDLVDIAHEPEKHKPYVDTDMDAGRVLASICHLNEHLDMMQADPTWNNIRAVELRSQQLFQSGLHHRELILKKPELLEIDRQVIVQSIEIRGLDPREFILNLNNPEEVI